MELTPEEKKALLTEFVEASRAEAAKEAKGDIEAINKLLKDLRKANDDALEGKMTAADFKEFETKTLATEVKFKERIDLVETKMKRVGLEDPNKPPPVEGAVEYKAAFYNYVRDGGSIILDD